ncbi:phosphoribosyl-dephospho-CoA transferase [Yersinia frederiksenii]|nr:phosphoribosyl-dephospho-CoA transferase [Yersinia frederiksenii]CNK05092.1 phosphoribosyl-dephospho-CoA transferase [Yersinia frederiksenii]
MNSFPGRHTLCWLNRAALLKIASRLAVHFPALPADQLQLMKTLLLSGELPGICRRATGNEGEELPLGFCFPFRWQGQRLRLAVSAPYDAVVKSMQPEQIARLPVTDRFPITGHTPALKAFKALQDCGSWQDVILGVWGSVALDIVTPWNWTDEKSDLDIRLTPRALGNVEKCFNDVQLIEKKYLIRIDGEIRLNHHLAINLKEWCQQSSSLLVKGEQAAFLTSRQQAVQLVKTEMLFINVEDNQYG